MFAKLTTAILIGMEAVPISVEMDVSRRLSYFSIVGLGDKAVQESKERIIAAIRNQGFVFTPERIIVNLGPADVGKSGSGFDLAIALAYLVATGQVDPPGERTIFLGELALDGSVQHVPGLLALVDSLRKQGFKKIFAPKASVTEIVVPKVDVIYVDSLNEVIHCLRDDKFCEHLQGEVNVNYFRKAKQKLQRLRDPEFTEYTQFTNFQYIHGNFMAKRAMLIAALGDHNLLMFGLPGSGKSMLAKAFPSLLPSPTKSEKLILAKVKSLLFSQSSLRSNLTDNQFHEKHLTFERPFRSPHHSITLAGMIGGGAIPFPGEVTRAHLGTLFLDELPEFSTDVLESLRQPLQEGIITISRNKRSITFPTNFHLLAAMNPCKCGYFGSEIKCKCSAVSREKYLSKVSGPVLDRIDLHVGIENIDYPLIFAGAENESSETMRSRVTRARQRLLGEYVPYLNSENSFEISKLFNNKDLKLFQDAIQKFHYSTRVYAKLLRVALSISCLNNESPRKSHLMEALAYRPKNGLFS